MITLTPAAAEQIKRVMPTQEDDVVLGLRLAAQRQPNGDIDYGMGFDEQREFDFEIAIFGVNILIGPKSRDLLEGVTLDFVEMEPGQFNFIFIPPQEKSGAEEAKA